jgi:hypothetical protein
LRSKVEVPQRSLPYVTHRLMVMHPNTKYNWPISKDKNFIVWTRKYYLKYNYLTLRSKVKVPWRSLRYTTHRLMVMHPHTKYHWPISKDKNVRARTRKYCLIFFYLTLRSKVKVPQRSLRYATHRLMAMHPNTKYNWPIAKDKNVMVWTRKYYLKNNLSNLSIVVTLGSLTKWPLWTGDLYKKGLIIRRNISCK